MYVFDLLMVELMLVLSGCSIRLQQSLSAVQAFTVGRGNDLGRLLELLLLECWKTGMVNLGIPTFQ
jgi:hypothetical protein